MHDSTIEIRRYSVADHAGCRAVLATLPDWFGLPASNEAYLANLANLAILPSWVATDAGRVVGFTSMRVHNPRSVELEVLAVERERHRQGIGRRLVGAHEAEIDRRPEVTLFHVKTRGPSQPDPGYERTRHFYESLGFEPLFETEALWGPQDPALVMVRPVGTRD